MLRRFARSRGPVITRGFRGRAWSSVDREGADNGVRSSFAQLFDRLPNKIAVVFIPVFLVTILVEALVIQARHGSYSWKNTGISTLLAVGHLLTQAAAHGVIFGFIAAAVYQFRLTTIPVSLRSGRA